MSKKTSAFQLWWFGCLLLASILFLPQYIAAEENSNPDPKIILREAMNYVRDISSHGKARMVIRRGDDERQLLFEAWTRGGGEAIVRFLEPAKDAGNAILKINQSIWAFNPKTRQVVKIPAAMSEQSWMGSDFSYKDIARVDDVVNQYEHRIIGLEQSEGQTVYNIESTPHDNAPVVWGKETFKVRADHIITEHAFWDQNETLVKKLIVRKIAPLSGKLYPVEARMISVSAENTWTDLVYQSSEFGMVIPDWFFTQSNLATPRRLP